jgi:hypothetical protein
MEARREHHPHGGSRHLRRVHALMASAAAHQGGLAEDEVEVQAGLQLLSAWDDEMLPLTRSEVAERAGMATDPHFDARFDILARYGALVQHRGKAKTARWVPSSMFLVGAQLIEDLAHDGADARLAELILHALDRLDDGDLGSDELLALAVRLTRTIHAVTAEINRAVSVGAAQELLDANPSTRAQRQVQRVSDFTTQARRRFPEHLPKLRELVEAAGEFSAATGRLADRLTDYATVAGTAGLFALLSPETVTNVARRAERARLARCARDTVFDAPRAVLVPDELTRAAGELGRLPPPRTPPPVPDPDGAIDPQQTIAEEEDRERLRAQARSRWATATLAGTDTAVVTDDVWPAPVQRLFDGLLLASDRRVPVTLDLSTDLHVDPPASVAVNTPARLRRLDTGPQASEGTTASARAQAQS